MRPVVEGMVVAVMVVEEMGLVVEGMGAVVKVAVAMELVEGVTVEEETAAVVAATAARTSCS
jgi:hypothetical protein